MDCPHCTAWNDDDERRCMRCGRRLHVSNAQAAPDSYPILGSMPIRGSALPALEPIPGGRTTPLPEIPERQVQPSLFRDSAPAESFPSPKVIPIPMLTPVRSATRRNAGARTPSPRNNRRMDDSQQALNFDSDTALENPLDMKVEAVIYCDAPVALPVHRLIAAAVDASVVAIGLGVFLAIFYLSGGHVAWTKTTALVMLGAVWAVAQFYRLLWCLGDGDSPGMRFAGLRLVNFDGRLPDREQRGIRQAAYLLSQLSVGLGLIWALVDEENLTWHDHISKTFPTPG